MKDTIDLIPREMSARRNVRSRATAWAVVGVAALLAVMLSLVSMLLQTRRSENAVAELRDRVAQMRAAKELLPPLRQQLDETLSQHQLATRLLLEPAWNDVISDLSAATNGQIWIQNLQMDQPLNQPAEAGAPATIIVTGSASGDLDLLQFMNRFAASPRLEALVLQQSRPEPSEEVSSARVDFVVQGNLKQWVPVS